MKQQCIYDQNQCLHQKMKYYFQCGNIKLTFVFPNKASSIDDCFDLVLYLFEYLDPVLLEETTEPTRLADCKMNNTCLRLSSSNST